MTEFKRNTYIAGNWKMNKLRSEAKELVAALAAALKSDANLPEVIVCPPFTSLDLAREACGTSVIKLGAQNLSEHDSGAYTGEVSAKMLVDAGCTYVIIGHSERRQFYGETNQSVPLKVKAALDNGLVPIICVGELLDERENNLTDPVVKRQVGAAVSHLSQDELKKVLIAYEPVWAIGTGKVCESQEAARVVSVIRGTLKQFFENKDHVDEVPVLYGGSMNTKNADELLAQDEIDGGLIGGASLKAEDFLSIVNSASNRPRLTAARA